MGRRILKSIALVAVALSLGAAANAQETNSPVKIGLLNDQSSMYSGSSGPDSVVAMKFAVEDFGDKLLGQPIEVLSADHQNKPDVGLTIARQWLENDGVDAIFDIQNSTIALGVNTLLGQNKKLGFIVSSSTDRPTEADCNGYVHSWAYDSYSIVSPVVKFQTEKGNKSFFVISSDYEAGKLYEKEVMDAVSRYGAKTTKAIRIPVGTTDFSTYLLEAQSSGAKVLTLTVTGADLINALKQVKEYGIDQSMTIAVVFLAQGEAKSVGLETLRGTQLVLPWVWTLDDKSRAFAERMRKATGRTPSFVHAGVYSATLQYLKAVEAAGTKDPDAVLKQLHKTKIDDLFAHNGTVWPNGRLIHDMVLVEARAPGEVTDPDDLFSIKSVISAETAFRPLEKTKCKLVNE